MVVQVAVRERAAAPREDRQAFPARLRDLNDSEAAYIYQIEETEQTIAELTAKKDLIQVKLYALVLTGKNQDAIPYIEKVERIEKRIATQTAHRDRLQNAMYQLMGIEQGINESHYEMTRGRVGPLCHAYRDQPEPSYAEAMGAKS